MNKKHILLTNDDGVDSPSIWQLYDYLSEEFDCSIVAPADERSAMSHAISLYKEIDIEPLIRDTVSCGYKVWGTPADCVKIALCELLPETPHLIVSGINNGANIGVSIFYSGTVAAAREGAIMGIPSLALSVSAVVDGNVSYACQLAGQLIPVMLDQADMRNLVVNVNVPPRAPGQIQGIKVTPQAASYFDEWFEKCKISENGRRSYVLRGELIVHDPDEENDVAAINAGFVSITPLILDLTGHSRLDLVDSFVKDMHSACR